MDEPAKNRVWPETCRHVAKGELAAVERLEVTLQLVTAPPPHDDDYRYVKGPDSVQLCAFCAGKLLGVFYKECV